MPDNGSFELGLVMAGAVSGGAYTAGVMDFLIEALDAWEAAKERGERAPTHEVNIKVVTGTSAGAMNTALAAVMLNEDFAHVHEVPAPPEVAARNKAYKSWVVDIDIAKMLTATDLDSDRPLCSLLNSDPLDDIAERAIRYTWSGRKRRYVDDALPVILALTNLRGVPYSVSFAGGPAHEMSLHADLAEFALVQPDTAAPDTALPLPADDPEHRNWTRLKDAALASGAFPVGLRARPFERPVGYYETRTWPVPTVGAKDAEGNCICFEPRTKTPDWKDERPDGTFHSLNVDGGVINNEPFEQARQILAGGPGKRNPRKPEEAHRAVLMIDPFPNVVDFEADYVPADHDPLIRVLGRLVSVVIQNSRFKRDEIVLSGEAGEKVYSRFLIAPARSTGEGEDREEDRRALVSGCVNAFGGFLSQAFREHDYMLGRRNCQQFLRKHFVLRADNERAFGTWPDEMEDVKRRLAIRGEDGHDYLPIIPLLPLPEEGNPYKPNEGLRQSIGLVARPRLSARDLRELLAEVKRRTDAVFKAALAETGLPGWAQCVARSAWCLYGRGKAVGRIGDWLEKDLDNWDVLERPGASRGDPLTGPDRGR